MNKEDVLKKAQSQKAIVGEMEHSKINTSNWIAVIVASFVAIIFMVVLGF